jgi:hypothetical protein
MPNSIRLICQEANKSDFLLAFHKQAFCDYYTLTHEQPFDSFENWPAPRGERESQNYDSGHIRSCSGPLVLPLYRKVR